MSPTTDAQAVRLSRFGDADVLELARVPIPQPVDDEVLVRVHAASVNPVDAKTRSGDFPAVAADDLPIILGRDLAGTIEAVGTRAHYMLSKGDRVFAHINFDRGAQAEFVVVRAVELVAVPSGVDLVTSAGLGLAGMTAWQGLFDHGGLQPGQTVLIHGGAGGVGHLAVQFARAKGARVIVTASDRDRDFVRQLGADQVIDYRAAPFENHVRDADVVLDLVGGDTGRRSLDVLAPGGILVSTLEPPAEELAREKGVRVAPRFLAEPNAAQLGEIARLVETGEVTVSVAHTFPLERIADAHRALEQGGVRGKIVMTIGGPDVR